MNIFFILGIIVVFISSLSQILLKSSANDDKNGIRAILNYKVILAYSILFLMMFINSKFIYMHIEMKKIAVIEAFSYMFIPGLSLFMLKEKISKKQIIGILIILLGICVYSI